MTLTREFLNEMFRIWGDRIDKPFEAYLLVTYEEDPFPNEWSEQDLYEQIRKLIFQYEQGNLDIEIPSTEERQKVRYEALKDSYLELLDETSHLREIIEDTRRVLDKRYHAPSAEDTIF
jgi:chromosomal replication initiation ATPase DnaA